MKINIYEYPTDSSLLPAYRIAVMQAAFVGEKLECKSALRDSAWFECKEPMWCWRDYRYRIAKPAAPRFFRARDGLFGPTDSPNNQYCLRISHDDDCVFFHLNGSVASRHETHSTCTLKDALFFVSTGAWVEFNGDMAPFRPKEPAKPTTIMGWLLTLPQPYRTLAIKNMAEKNAENYCSDIIGAIGYGFSWAGSPEGTCFWSGVYNHYIRGGNLPPIPQFKKLVPWTVLTAPKGHVLHRYKNGSKETRLIIGWFDKGVALASWFQIKDSEFYGNLIVNSEHSLDSGKTWLPCGTEE